jgi:hypothetical protein
VFEALSQQLSPEVRARLRVDVQNTATTASPDNQQEGR